MRLTPNLDLTAATPLWANLMEAAGAPVTLIANDVTRLSAPCLQVLLAASAAWSRNGLAFRISAPSAVFLEALEVMGAQDAFIFEDAGL